MKYGRVLLKLSGRAVSGNRDFGFSSESLEHIADEVLALHAKGVQISIVIGGGNIFQDKLDLLTWG